VDREEAEPLSIGIVVEAGLADTTFNRLQMEQFLTEWRLLYEQATPTEREFLAQVEDLAKQCASNPHLYLRFYGD
jgi:hypothetical protein